MSKQVDVIKQTGATFTPKDLANFLAEKIYTYQKSNNIKVLDPACGDGELLMAMSDVLQKKNNNFELYGFDSNDKYLDLAKKNIQINNRLNANLILSDFLEVIDLKKKQLSLFEGNNSIYNEFADLIIANPPYVRTQVLGSSKAQLLSKKYGLKGRVDLYYPFLIAMTHALKKGGIIGVITSNRYLSTKSGESVRKYLSENYEILEVIDLGDTKLFDAAVLPAIFIGRKKTNHKNFMSKFYKIYEELNGYKGKLITKKSVFEILNSEKDGYFKVDSKRYKKSTGILKLGNTKENTWSMLSKDEAIWISEIKSKSNSQVKDHFKVRVGIKTTADKVFISNKWDTKDIVKPEVELLKDLISQQNLEPWKINYKINLKVLYPHYSINGKKHTISLEKYPKAKEYFEIHEEKLKNRKYLIEAGRKWYEIWVPHNPTLWKYPKLVFPDISLEPRFYFDETGKIVNGNCYWIVAEKEEDKDLLLLIQGIANSKLMTRYHDLVFNNKLYSGRRRYISQYVENYPLPDINSKESQIIIETVKEINDQEVVSKELLERLEVVVAQAYNTKPVFNLD
ncbi:MAG: N-6 DNA methylase [Candidatus Delongbacteria bacterium]|nr:N-6 DNA methylase [Candidatus Delongbacteria bacterium]